jgi:hypothetical protein
MQAIVGRLEGLLERLRRVNVERLFVVSILVATLTGSLYVFLEDFRFAGSPDQVVAADHEVADRIAPIGRVTLAETAVAAARTDAAGTNAPAGASAPLESSAEGGIAEASASDADSTDVAAASDASPEVPPDQAEAQAAVSADPIAVQSASAEAGAGEFEPSVPSEELRTPGPAVTAETPRPAPIFPQVPPGYMPMPAQGYGPVYPQYQAPPSVSRPAPGAPSRYAPGPYRAYPPTRYNHPAAPAAGYPPPQGWMR